MSKTVKSTGSGFLESVGLTKFLNKSEKLPRTKAVLVLGNGRSGTSVLTRALNFMGVDLGDDPFIKAKKANPKGYFENKPILTIHKKIGGKLPFRPSPEGYEKSKKIRPLKNELKEYMKETFLDKPVWGWKDPRTNDYLKLWKDILNELNAEPHHVIIIRNPIDVVASNKRAWDRDETWALRQWQLRTLFSLRDTFGDKRVIISYEELFGNPIEALRRISTTLDLPWPADEVKLKQQLEEFIDPNLQRSNSNANLEDFLLNDQVGQDVKQLYLLALEGTQSQEYFESNSFHERVEKLYDEYLNNYGTLKRNPPEKNKA
ncbi:sulfotransferase [Pullulanibacillus sp. KACC 23026]|uniref:sulfotransferase family protein n=1 Tax=Pullulanibacillus sp. KACC 23026 TaxID=3028315 RepID=UPI0023B0A36D|nr:sulfotransferase [Pullulanibacillus sp. KACC 23026]WEG11210.1 sulfotransferase [Pullulanibacillus sp. KACC 23026]